MKRFLILLLAVLMLIPSIPLSAQTKDMPFADVVVNGWYEESVLYCYKYGYIKGTAFGIFSPGLNLTRAMAVQILYAMSGDDTDYSQNVTFDDVSADKWYYNAIEWAYENEIVHGTGNGCFSPNINVSRQDFYVMLYNYSLSYSHNKTGDYTSLPHPFADSDKIAQYALTAVDWAYSYGLLSGYSDNTVKPSAYMTRAEISSVIMRFDHTLGHDWKLYAGAVQRSCSTDGYAKYVCSICPSYTEVRYEKGHVNKLIRTSNPTCIQDGVTEYYCLNCGHTNIITSSATGHHWQVSTTAASCTVNGKRTYTCLNCGIKNTEVIYAQGHKWKVNTTLATCTADGKTVKTCTVCSKTETEILKSPGHAWKCVSVVHPTRKAPGYSNYLCTVCNAAKKDDHTPILVNPSGWDSNYDGMLTIDEYLGAYDMKDFLATHKSDYVGTPYISLAKHLNEPWMLLRNKGQYPKNSGMNCTGFIASVVSRCNGDLAKITNSSQGSYANAYNWLKTILNKNIYHYTFYSIPAALNSGKLKKGDIVLFIPPAKSEDENADFHFGFFWGDYSSHDLFWHSTGPTEYNKASGIRYSMNQITKMCCGTAFASIYVLPMQTQ